MKSLAKLAALYILCLMVLPSCTKENVPVDGPGKEQGGERVISAQFDNSTKVALGTDGLTFTFNNGDKIRVSNSSQSEECTIDIVVGRALFVTNLDGALTAVYPSDAAVLTGGENSAIASPGFKVPASQDGDVAKAIIAKAEITDGSLCAVFTSQVALFEVTPPSGVTSFAIKSLNKIDPATGRRSTSANAEFINTVGTTDADKRVINVTAVPSGGKAYVALKPGVNLGDLSFEYITDGTNGLGAMKGIPLSKFSDGTTKANYKYGIDNADWHPYVAIDGLKWATRNIGATADYGEDSYGKYFAWGEVDGRIPSSSTFSTPFNWAHAPFNNGSSDYNSTYFASVKDTVCPNGILTLENDAAYVNWGGAWRMPTQEEIDKPIAKKQEDSANKGYTYGTYPNQIFLPAVGEGDETSLKNAGTIGHYWSSSLDPSLRFAYFLSLTYFAGSAHERPYGLAIRPVAD